MLLALATAFMQVQTVRATSCTVTNSADSGVGTLRALLADISCSIINFDADQTIRLASQLTINRDVTMTELITMSSSTGIQTSTAREIQG